ncbi:MAG: stage II sporulation protein R [Ruminococcus sp.]|nr:stage II sporulation protein R [Ruminococcus sp.]
MKLLFKSFAIAFVLSVIFSMIPFSAQCKNVSDNVFRLHILANSDSESDQNLKLKVRDKVLEYTENLYKSAVDLQNAEQLTKESLQDIANVAQKEVLRNGYSYPVSAEVKKVHFNTRCYDNVTMPSGDYEALRITIGEGKGHNWWCVMYPSLCVGAATNYEELKNKTADDEYRIMTDGGYNIQFKVVEYFQNIVNFFHSP